MTHDPMCEWAECICPRGYDDERGHLVHCPDQDCECEFIAKVRADQRDKDRQTVDALFPTDLPNLSWVGYGQGILDATEALSAT